MADRLVSVVIPLFNEGAHLHESLRVIREAIASCGLPFELVVVDDGSSDTTWSVVTGLRESAPEIHAYRFSRNFGKEAALSAGLEHARGDAVIIIDGDLQHPPAMIPEMIRLWRDEGFEVVDAVKASRGHESAAYRTSAELFNFLMTRLSGFDLAGASDFKLLDRKVVDAWLRMDETQLFYRGMVAWLGFRRATLPFDVVDRSSGGTTWSWFRLTRLAITAITSFSSLPLHVVTFLGLLFLLASVIVGAQVLYMYATGQAVTGFTTVILLQLGIGAIMMVSLGIIGEYIASIYNETKRRPRYVIAESIAPAADERSCDGFPATSAADADHY